MADVRLIVDGFLDLTRASQPRLATNEATAPAATPAIASTAASVPSTSSTLSTPSTLSSGDEGIVAPTAVFQPPPTVPPALLTLVRRLHRTSTIDVVINERGTVDDVIVKQPVTPAYDRLIVAAARTWRYKPALKDGVPTKFVSTVLINVGAE